MSDDLSVEKSGQNSSVGIRGRDRFAVELVPVRNEEELPHVKVEQRRRLGRLVKRRRRSRRVEDIVGRRCRRRCCSRRRREEERVCFGMG